LISSSPCVHAPAPTGCCPLSLHDALPISLKETESAAGERKGAASKAAPKKAARISTATNCPSGARGAAAAALAGEKPDAPKGSRDRKSTRLNSSHVSISYAVFCLKKKKCK